MPDKGDPYQAVPRLSLSPSSAGSPTPRRKKRKAIGTRHFKWVV